MRRSGPSRRWWVAIALLAACGGSGNGGVDPDPAVAPFVGTWDATVYEIWPDADPSFVVDVLVQFGPFHITVEPSGQYTAVIENPQVSPQIGQLSVVGSTIRLDVTTPPNEPTATATYTFEADDYLVLDGPVEIDFNGDDIDDPGQSHIELQRR